MKLFAFTEPKTKTSPVTISKKNLKELPLPLCLPVIVQCEAI